MAGPRYRPFIRQDFEAEIIGEMKFQPMRVEGALEFAYHRIVTNGPFPSKRFDIQVYSTVDLRTGMTRDTGKDAIRVMLRDIELNRTVLEWKVLRTQGAFRMTRQRCQEAWGYVMNPSHHCPDCGALLTARKGKRGDFLGCTNYPNCRFTRPITAPLALREHAA
jgi:hypothetical protein